MVPSQKAVRATKRAAKRVGRRAEDQFEWLLNLATADLTKASRRRLDRLRWEMHAFVGSNSRVGRALEYSLVGLDAADAATTVRTIHRQLREGFGALRTQGVFMLPTGAIAGLEWLEGQRRLVPVAFGTADQRFFAAVADVLDAIGPKLRACADPACSRLFLRHGRKDYCSGRCSQKIRTAKYRSEHPEKVREWKRQEYASHQRAQHGKPNLIIAKRRPQKRRAAQPQMARRVEW